MMMVINSLGTEFIKLLSSHHLYEEALKEALILKEALTLKEALKEALKWVGASFPSRLVNAFLALVWVNVNSERLQQPLLYSV